MTTTRVFILGAGFSRAISSHMPLVSDLRDAVLDRLSEADRPTAAQLASFTRLDFESWLSRLAEDQPDLSEAENLRNRSLFAALIEATYELIIDAQRGAHAEDTPPAWLQRLIGLWHHTRSGVVTFNYDTLLESAVEKHLLLDWSTSTQVEWYHPAENLPPFAPQPSRWAGTQAATFRLTKLHGSTNVFWSPGDRTGVSISKTEPIGRWGSPVVPDERVRRNELPGRVPFIIPPAAIKAPWYDNPITREFWRRAREEISAADEIVVVGYSVPMTDLVAAGMLAEAASSNVSVRVIDLAPAAVAERLAKLGIDRDAISTSGGKTALKRFTDEWAREQSAELAGDLGAEKERDIPVAVAWSEAKGAPVVAACSTRAGTELTIEAPGPLQTALGRRDPSDPVPLTLAQIDAEARGSGAVWAKIGRSRWILVDRASWTTDLGHAPRWHVLVPADAPPD